MQAGPPDLAQVRLDNALALFEEFVRATARHADAATLRGLERRFAERVQIQPSYWSQIKGRSRQIGERLARQFEHLCQKPSGWMDRMHGGATLAAEAGSAASANATNATNATSATSATRGGAGQAAGATPPHDESAPRDDDERFIVGLVLTYYRRHPQRARTRLLDLLGEVLTPQAVPSPDAATQVSAKTGSARSPAPTPEEPMALWQRTQAGVAPLKRKK